MSIVNAELSCSRCFAALYVKFEALGSVYHIWLEIDMKMKSVNSNLPVVKVRAPSTTIFQLVKGQVQTKESPMNHISVS
jgi:hypothetical protein